MARRGWDRRRDAMERAKRRHPTARRIDRAGQIAPAAQVIGPRRCATCDDPELAHRPSGCIRVGCDCAEYVRPA